MFANSEFSFPGRKNVPLSSNSNDMPAIPRSSSRNSMHGRQIGLSSAAASATRANGSISNGNTNAAASSSGSSTRPASGSHHRRRSSVSSRRESREMMGIAIDDSSEDHHPPIGGGGVDQRQRALWALEGKKPAASSPVNALILGFQKVELPDWHTPSDEKDGFNWSPTSASSSSNSLSQGSSSAIKHHSLTPITPTNAGVGGNAFNFSLTNTLANKRDSFGKNLISASSSLKAELHTLLEEDEEEEEDEDEEEEVHDASSADESKAEVPVYVQEPESLEDATEEEEGTDDTPVQHDTPITPITAVSQTNLQITPRVIPPTPSRSVPTMCSPPRPKPSLRPLSLIAAHHQPIATPTISPSPRLKSLTLAAILPLQNQNQQNTHINSNVTTTPPTTMNAGRRNSSSLLTMNGVVAPLTPSPSPSPNYNTMMAAERQLRRQSSIGYRRGSSSSSLSNPNHTEIITPSRRSSKRQSIPSTPSLTPSAARSMTPTTPSDSFSSSRASSEFFHTQAVSSLLVRIASLEEALQTAAASPAASKYGSFPLTPESSQASSPLADRLSSPCNHEPVDELISCIADLKGERDELTNDVSGWRMRCGDLERSCDVLGRRLAEERKELWLVRDRVAVLDAEVQAERVSRAKLEAEVAEERTAVDAERQAKVQLEETINGERADWVREEMRFDGQRLKWAKERRGWEMERELLAGERRLMEEAVARKDEMIKTLERRVQEAEQMRMTSFGGDLSLTPRAKGPWNGAGVDLGTGFAFPPLSLLPTPNSEKQDMEFTPQSPSVAEAPSSSVPFTPKQGAGSLNAGFKFGGGAPRSAFSPSTPDTPVQRPKVSSPTSDKGFALGAVVEEEEEEEEEDCLQNYEDEEDGDVSFSCHGSDDFSGSDDHHSTANATFTVPPALDLAPVSSTAPVVAPPQTRPAPAPQQQPAHSHRRSVSTIQKWRFPGTVSRRSNNVNAANAKPVDPFFACLESEEDDDAARRIGVVGKQMKAKEHKKLPSGCPAFWLDCDESETVLVSSALPLPSPAITEEEDNGVASESTTTTPAATTDSECDDVQDLPPRKSDSSTPPIPFPTVARPVAASTSSTIHPTALAEVLVNRTAATRVSLARPPQAAPPNRSRVVPAPTFIPAQSHGVGSPVRSLVRSVPPAASPVMAVPPTLRMDGMGSPGTSPAPVTRPIYRSYDTAPPAINIASPTSPSFPVAASSYSSSVSFTSRFQTLSNMIPWPTKASPAPSPRCSMIAVDDDDESSSTATQQHTPNASFAPSPSPSPAKPTTMGKSSPVRPKLVDPSVMRERLRAQLEKDGRLGGGGSTSGVGPTETEPCGSCYATNVVEL